MEYWSIFLRNLSNPPVEFYRIPSYNISLCLPRHQKIMKKVSLVTENTKCILTKRPEILSSPIKHSSYFFPFYSFVFLLIREKTHRDAIKQQLLNNIARKKQRSLNAPARECDVRKMEVTNSDFS